MSVVCAFVSPKTIMRRRRRRSAVASIIEMSLSPPSSSSSSSQLHKNEERRGAEEARRLALQRKDLRDQTAASTGTGNSRSSRKIVGNDAEWKFFDTARLHTSGGSGGNGCVAFRRELGEPMGGPAGGRGGRGGSVYLRCDKSLNTLASLRNSHAVHVRAKHGSNGTGKNRDGLKGHDVHVLVPPGTIVKDLQTQKIAGELRYHGDTLLVARGGRGGRGNAAFATSRRTAPKLAERGEPGVSRWIFVELRLVADVGFLGLPNAGKSTLLAAASAARPKIADYPFTTIVPNLGVCDLLDDSQNASTSSGLVLCDIPGLIEGAADGAGLGPAFLRHVQRCRVLLHIIDGTSEDPLSDYRIINQELRRYDSQISLANKPQVIVLNKMDVPAAREKSQHIMNQLRAECQHSRILSISAATTEGVKELMRRVKKFVDAEKCKHGVDINDILSPAVVPEIDFSKAGLDYDSDDFEIMNDPAYPGQWRISGPYIEQVAKMTHWEYPEAIERFGRQLDALGISSELEQRGAVDGDLVMVDEYDFEFAPSMTNPYIPQELLDIEDHNDDSVNFMSSSTSKKKKHTQKGSDNKDENNISWRPFSEGGYLDVDTDELDGFNNEEGDWDLLDAATAEFNEEDFDDDDDDQMWTS